MTATIPPASPSIDSERNPSPRIPEDRVHSSNLDSSVPAPQPGPAGESWDNWGDHEVWLAARRMLESLNAKDEKHTDKDKKSAQESEVEHDQPETNLDAFSTEPKIKPKGFVLERRHADLLLLNKTYFIVFPSIYCFDQNRIICRITEGFRYQEVDEIKPNPPRPESIFHIQGIPYWFDSFGVLWYQFEQEWLMETMYRDLQPALDEIVRCIEINKLHLPADPPSIQSPSSDGSWENDVNRASLSSPSFESDDGESLRPLSSNPDQMEIDNWIEDLKNHRAVQTKAGGRLPAVQCPIPTCRKVQRRPQALRDHLYFHYNVKPHKCDYGCNVAFETEANKNRHLETCTARWAYRG